MTGGAPDPVRAQLRMELEERVCKFAEEHIEPHLPKGVEFIFIYADPDRAPGVVDGGTDLAMASNMDPGKRAVVIAAGWPQTPSLASAGKFVAHIDAMRDFVVTPPEGISAEDMDAWMGLAKKRAESHSLDYRERDAAILAKAVLALAPLAKRIHSVALCVQSIGRAELARLRELHLAADRGPWGAGDPDSPGVVWSDAEAGKEIARGMSPANAALVAAARMLVPRLGSTFEALTSFLPKETSHG